MNDNDLFNMWQSYDHKLNQILRVNTQIMEEITHHKVQKLLSKTNTMKWIALFIGIPYLVILYILVGIGIKSGGLFFTFGMSAIALITSIVVGTYLYHIYLIHSIDNNKTVTQVQRTLAKLRLSSFKVTRLAILQIPFWTICWWNIKALMSDNPVYAIVNSLVFGLLCYITYWLYISLDIKKLDTKVNRLFFSGIEWDPIVKSEELLAQIEEYNDAVKTLC